MNDALRRGARTFVQAFVGTLALMAIPFLQDLMRSASSGEAYQFNFDLLQAIVVSALAAGFIALITWAQNELEDRGAIPTIGKTPSSSGAHPAPDPMTSNEVRP